MNWNPAVVAWMKNFLPRMLLSATVILTCAAVVAAVWVRAREHSPGKTAAHMMKRPEFDLRQVAPLSGPPDLDADSLNFEELTEPIQSAMECFPVHVGNSNGIDILYQYCSHNAAILDNRPVIISENFAVPATLARRYNFWRRVYSLWSIDQYVIHPSAYPEVILEAYDIGRVGHQLSPAAQNRLAQRFAARQKAKYRKVLLTMHRYRNERQRYSPVMKRLARALDHIDDDRKYLNAARMLRTQRGQRDFFARGLRTSMLYLPAIEDEFARQGIPREIARLAFVESSFNLSAMSKVGASGVFQIMPETGRQYLIVNDYIDERNDPIKAAKAAAKLLKMNFEMTGKWSLAISAYNHGVGGILNAVKRSGSRNMDYLIENYYGETFGFASRNFYLSFLGILGTLADADRIFSDVPAVKPLEYVTVKLQKSQSIKDLRRKYRLSSSEIGNYNPDISAHLIRSGGYLPRAYVIKIPADAIKAQVSARKRRG